MVTEWLLTIPQRLFVDQAAYLPFGYLKRIANHGKL